MLNYRILVVSLLTLCTGVADAQATRTWVSGVGDDVNPCSRTAPCKTFAGAISKTAAGGEISVLDPGGYGSVTITKSITINGEGTYASMIASGVDGILVKAGANDLVIIRNITINGAGTGLDGIRFTSGGALVVDRVKITGFTGDGIEVSAPSGTSKVVVNELFATLIMGSAVKADGSGARVHIEKSNITFSGIGLQTVNGGTAHMSNVSFVNDVKAIDNGGKVVSFGNNRFSGNTIQYSGTPVQTEKTE